MHVYYFSISSKGLRMKIVCARKYINNDPPASSRRPCHHSAPPAPPDGLFGSVAPYQPSSLVKGCRFAPGFGRFSAEHTGCARYSARSGQHTGASKIWSSRAREVGTASQRLNLQIYIYFVCLYFFVTLSFPSQPSISSKFRPILFFPFVVWGAAAAASVLSIPANRVEGELEGGARTRCISR